MTDKANISTGFQPKGAARNPSDTLDKPTSAFRSDQSKSKRKPIDDQGFATNGE